MTAAALDLPVDVTAWLAERTAGWPPEQVAELAEQVREQVLARRKLSWRQDPAGWARDRARSHLWSKQHQLVTAVRDHPRVAVQSCHGAGKSYTAAQLTGWWLDVHPPGSAFVVTTAPTFAQVRAVLWREIGKLHRRAGLPGRVNQTEWHFDGELVGFGRKPSDHDEAAFQGIHAEHVLIVMDEAGGVPEQLYVAAESIAVGAGDRIVLIGNPDDPSGPFAKACSPGNPIWHTLRISAFDTPNLTGETMPNGVPGGMVTREWVDRAREQWGEDSPLWQSKVEGLFPTLDEQSVVRYPDVQACRQLDERLTAAQLRPVELGVDVGGGGDATSIRARHGRKVGRRWTARTPQPEQVVDLVMRAVVETPGVTSIKIDVGGIGWGIAGDLRKTLRAARNHARVVPVNFGAAPRDRDRLLNVRGELWWDVGRGLSKDRGWDLTGLDDDTVAQLTAPRYSTDPRGRIVIEPKEDVIKRTGRSPDDADALLLAFWTPYAAPAEAHAPTGSIPTGTAAARR